MLCANSAGKDKVEIELKLHQYDTKAEKAADVLDTMRLPLAVRQPNDLHARTFLSGIDGSVQMYAVRPAAPGEAKADDKDTANPGIVLTLHGAAVDAKEQAGQYSAKTWAHIVAPTNRRPYGFDWEDWGRIDALEALADAQQRLGSDRRRVYVTGHSMGGHGAWHLGANYPDRFAAVGPSAGWVSFWTYGGMPKVDKPTKIQSLLTRATGPSDTLKLQKNLRQPGVYILHGDADDNVPVAQARLMRQDLGKFHPNFAYYEKPGGGHWWGAPSCDWPAMMEFFRQQQLPEAKDIKQIEFATTNPGVSSACHWVSIEAQQQQFEMSRVVISYAADKRQFHATTQNVARLAVDVRHLDAGKGLQFSFDGQRLPPVAWPASEPRVWFARHESRWIQTSKPAAAHKGPHRYGTFEEALNHRVLMIYGTRGTADENAWSLAKARYDAETFWYRGNAGVDVIPDTAFDAAKEPDRSVILYGNADTNGAWPALLSTCPVQIRRGQVRLGTRPESGNDVACLMVRPRPRSDVASVGVVSGTGLAGMRATNRLRYFVSGVAYPDLMVFGSGALTQGDADIRVAGYFGLDWTMDEGDFEWRDLGL